MYLLFGRFRMSLVGVPGMFAPKPPAPRFNSFCHVKATVPVSPWLYRLVNFACSESYQLLPRATHRPPSPPNCGYGRSDWASVDELGKPAYGALKPAAITCGELNGRIKR